MRAGILWCAAALAVAAGGAWADTRQTEDENRARFEQYAGKPVDGFTMWQMYQWQLLGPDRLAVWTGVNDVYMLRVETPCINLENAKAVQITSKMSHRVSVKLDFVNFGSQQCQILEIRPIDYKAMVKSGAAPDKRS